ncbi:glycan-binding surface protein [Mariniflexile litorale]|uniref:Glycan-binding surface protein n=1 Tax=Mariniflexile litorale TaxID=3045158 RepID=A0AAU7EGR6_9FLAO|nr:glycan-binding surface protein [Mariniflexile sp. KMM 9835]MDQ8210831.1 glycan-binding surface protein [Mariniflexile sp. KMM 9835]
MKINILNKNYWKTIPFLGLMVVSMLFTACENNESVGGGEIIISKVYLEDVNSSVQDREVTFARLGQLLRIEGSGFTGLKKVYINGLSTYFNPVYISKNSMLISVSGETPIVEATEDVRNTIRFVNDNHEALISFEIRSSAPTITNISNTLPLPGETVTVYGTGLTEVRKVTFPGNIEVTTGITDGDEGKSFTVVVPNGVSPDGGSLFIECSNGGAYSPAYFNFKKGLLLNFDGTGSHGFWGASTSMIQDVDLESASIGAENVSQGKYVAHRPARITSFAAATNRDSEVWTGGGDWRALLTSYIPATTPLGEVALQFDIYVPTAWKNSGFLKVCLINNFNGGEWAGGVYNYVPWLVDGKVVPFQTAGWTTVTIPLNKFYRFADADYTFEDVLAFREAATYSNFGLFFENSDIKLKDVTGVDSDIEFPSATTSVNVYTDNWRIVSLKTPTFSDFPE